MTGTCPTCQQSGIKVYKDKIDDDDPGRFKDGKVTAYILYDHDHQGGQRCEGSGQTAQFISK